MLSILTVKTNINTILFTDYVTQCIERELNGTKTWSLGNATRGFHVTIRLDKK